MTVEQPRIGIIGAGPSGIACGRALLGQGFTDFTISELLDQCDQRARVIFGHDLRLKCTGDRA